VLKNLKRHPGIFAVALAIVLTASSPMAWSAEPPVAIGLAINGNPAPGVTVTAKATVTINDGSTLQSIKWRQTGGVNAVLSNATTDTVTVALPDRKVFRSRLIHVLEESPLPENQLPAKVAARGEFRGGLQNRFSVVSASPHAMLDAAAVQLEAEVVTSSGTYRVQTKINTTLPWSHSMIGTRNVPVKVPVILQGKDQASWNWTLIKPAGSAAVLLDPTSRNPEFTPDVPGTYELRVADLGANQQVSLSIHAGKWDGMIVGQDAQGRPVADPACMTCHKPSTPHFDLFTPWAKSGHAEIFTQNVNNPAGHYSGACVSCHAVGFDTHVANGGMDDQPDFPALLESGLLTHGGLENWSQILTQFPKSARFANIQCENCHGPHDGVGHMKNDGSRKTQSSDLCGTCHGEPARHGRYQQWQLSAHANYELAEEEASNATCAKCHTSQGFIQWEMNKFSTANLTIDWKKEDAHPITCVTCHDPHYVGTTSGGPATNATVRISGTTPPLMSGFTATNVGRGAICMTCHNGRRGLRNDSNFSLADAGRAPHLGPQADVLMGQNMYFVQTGVRSNHANIEDACVTCHMETTPPPAQLSYNLGGTNHTFFARAEICSSCHTSITLQSVQGPIEEKMHALKHEIEVALKGVMQSQIRRGNAIDLGGKKITSAADIKSVELVESHGQQAVSVMLSNGTVVDHITMSTVRVVRPAGSPLPIYSVAEPTLAKAGWNFFMAESDKSKGAHNPTFVGSALDLSLFAVKAINANLTDPPAGLRPGIGGGPGTGVGAISCNTPFVYWAEIAAHTPGAAGSEWRTDLVARNLGTSTASLRFVLHQNTGTLEGNGSITGNAQKAFEDIVLMLGGENAKGSLEICSNEPLLVSARVFSQSPAGTFGQSFDGHIADLGYREGETVSLIGLRQKTGAFRSNISVTNAGPKPARVAIKLYDATGAAKHTYELTVPAGQVVQDTEPFAQRAGAPDLDWGFATVTVLEGTNIRTSASVIDMKTNDPTTIPAKQ
jgi:hypothetical protein